MIGGAIWLAAQDTGLAGTDDTPPPAPIVAAANGAANPYSVIMERNAFHLNPPPALPEPAKPPPPDLPQVKLSGFTRKGDHWKALLAVNTENPDPHGQKLTSYLALSEGDKRTVGSGTKQALVELVKIYADQEKIEIINLGTPMTLSMKDDGFESPAVAAGGRKGSAIVIRTPGPPMPIPATLPATGAGPIGEMNSRGGGSMPAGGVPSIGAAPSFSRDASDTISGIKVGGTGGILR
jgi:hypothetical protein